MPWFTMSASSIVGVSAVFFSPKKSSFSWCFGTIAHRSRAIVHTLPPMKWYFRYGSLPRFTTSQELGSAGKNPLTSPYSFRIGTMNRLFCTS